MAQQLQSLYADLDLTFNRTPVVGDVAMSFGDQAVIRSVTNLLLTNFYERPFQPNVGSNMDALLFEPLTDLTANMIDTEIRNVLDNYEPRVSINVLQVTTNTTQDGFNVYMEVFIGNNTSPTAVNLLLQRSR